MTAYRPPAWLPGGHAQTIYPLLVKPGPHVYRRERWQTPDEDFIDLDWSAGSAPLLEKPETPLVVLFHGLEGSSDSHYARALMHALAATGWAGVVVHWRGCSGEPNRRPRVYHSGDTAEIDWILRRLKTAHGARPLFAVGVSLGGNVLLKWLGERESEASQLLRAATAVSAPMDLAACGHNLARGFNRVYTRHFLASLVPNAAAKLRQFPDLFDARRLNEVRTVFEFDDLVTGPLHGYAGAEDYWRRASSKPGLRAIGLPTLILNARNDPFMPATALPTKAEVSPSVTLELPQAGGHVGFVSGRLPGNLDWLPRRVLRFFAHS